MQKIGESAVAPPDLKKLKEEEEESTQVVGTNMI